MKTIYNYLITYLKSHFNFKLYATTILFLSVLIYFNYKFDFEDSYIDAYYGKPIRMFYLFLIEIIPYYITLVFVYFFTDNKQFIRNKYFWFLSLFGFILLGINRGFYHHIDFAKQISTNFSYRYILKILSNLKGLLTIILPYYLIYTFWLKKDMPNFFGLQTKNINLKPYLVLILLMLPILYIASLQPDFLKVYPKFKSANGHFMITRLNYSPITIASLFELSYAFSFFIVEIIFRGFFIFAMVKYLGKDVVLPMAVAYCVLHFGKPLGETISSFFGGYLLGVIALKTNNIYGGILVHIGIALLMELFAFIQLY